MFGPSSAERASSEHFANTIAFTFQVYIPIHPASKYFSFRIAQSSYHIIKLIVIHALQDIKEQVLLYRTRQCLRTFVASVLSEDMYEGACFNTSDVYYEVRVCELPSPLPSPVLRVSPIPE